MQAASDRKPTVFISYRRETGFFLAKYIFDHLNTAGYDVFMDVQSLGAGEFEQTTLTEVAARDYFLLVLTSGSLKRMNRENDWLRKELMQAIKSRRTVVPVLAEDFRFEDHRVQVVLEKLPSALQALSSFNAVRIPPPEYFDSAMERLVSFLKAIAGSTPSHGTSKTSGTAAAPKSVAQAQSALHGLTLPPVTSLTKTQSATPWSDLHVTFADTGVVGANAPTLKKPVDPERRPALMFGKGLPAPTLKKESYGLSWTEVSKAEKYVLEESGEAEFQHPGTVVYQGPRTSWLDLSAGLLGRPSRLGTLTAPSRYYRVKAIGKGAAGESDWSNIVEIVAAEPFAQPRRPAPTSEKRLPFDPARRPAPVSEKRLPFDPARRPALVFEKGLPAPTLKRDGYGLSWTKVSKAQKYVLEESGEADFQHPGTVVYQGPGTSWLDLSAGLLRRLTAPSRYYRVKAIGKGAAGESDWSNIVEIVAAEPFGQPRRPAPMSEKRLPFDPARRPALVFQKGLPAPTLKKESYGLSWTEVSKAEKYVLEESGDAEFQHPGTAVYQGPKTSWLDLSAGLLGRPSRLGTLTAPSRYYRVKAIGKGTAGESGWSNIVGYRRSG